MTLRTESAEQVKEQGKDDISEVTGLKRSDNMRHRYASSWDVKASKYFSKCK
jgi:hypothetical protein